MKKIITSHIIENVRRQPFNKASLDHIQEAFSECFEDVLKALSSETSGVIVLHGILDADADADDYNLSAGAVYYQGEVFRVPAFVGTHATDVPVLTILTAFRAGDPLTFTDNNAFSVHEIRTAVWAMDAPGSGVVDFADLKRIADYIRPTSTKDKLTGKIYELRTLEIGAWDMDTNGTRNFDTLLDQDKFRGIVSILIRSDDGTIVKPLNSVNAAGVILGGVSRNTVIDNWICLIRFAVGNDFTGANFNDAVMNRGWVTILYEP